MPGKWWRYRIDGKTGVFRVPTLGKTRLSAAFLPWCPILSAVIPLFWFKTHRPKLAKCGSNRSCVCPNLGQSEVASATEQRQNSERREKNVRLIPGNARIVDTRTPVRRYCPAGWEKSRKTECVMKWLLILALLAVPSIGFSGECSKCCGVCAPRVKAAAVKVVKAPVRLVRCVRAR